MEEEQEEFSNAPEVGMQTIWLFRLSKQDALLVLKALRGVLKGPEVASARALCDRLTELRHKVGQDFAGGLERAYLNMEKAKETRGNP